MINKKSNKKLIDLIALVVGPLFGAVVSWIFNLGFLASSVVFFLPTILYLSYRNPAPVKRSLVFTSLMTVAGVCIDYFAVKDGSWNVPTVFNFKVLAAVSIEDIVWFFLITLFILSVYEFLIDHSIHKTVGKHIKYLYLILLFTVLFLGVPSLITGHSIHISYFYLKAGIFLGLLPVLTVIFEFPRFMKTLLKLTPYFFAVFFIEEIVGLHNGHWSFPGNHYIGWLNLASYRMPLEEFIFWIILFSSIIISYFEIFDDNRLKFKRISR